MTIQASRILAIQCLLFGLGGLSWATLPILGDAMPTFEWRVHFGLAEMFFGALGGFGAAVFLTRKQYI